MNTRSARRPRSSSVHVFANDWLAIMVSGSVGRRVGTKISMHELRSGQAVQGGLSVQLVAAAAEQLIAAG